MFGRTKSEKTAEAVGLGQPFLGVFRIVHHIDAERHQFDQVHARSWVFSRSLCLSPLALHTWSILFADGGGALQEFV